MRILKILHLTFVSVVLFGFGVLLITGSLGSTVLLLVDRFGILAVGLTGFLLYYLLYPLFDFGGTVSGSSSDERTNTSSNQSSDYYYNDQYSFSRLQREREEEASRKEEERMRRL